MREKHQGDAGVLPDSDTRRNMGTHDDDQDPDAARQARLAMGTAATDPRLRGLITGGVGRNVEYEPSLRWEPETRKASRELPRSFARTVAGFLNAEGGTVVLALSHDGKLMGLENDLATLQDKSPAGIERAIREQIEKHLGGGVASSTTVDTAYIGDHLLAIVDCRPHSAPVFLREDSRSELYVRSDSKTRALDAEDAVKHTLRHWQLDSAIPEELMRSVIYQDVPAAPPTGSLPDIIRIAQAVRTEEVPRWLTLATRRVLDLFLLQLSRSPGWKRLDIISPWIDEVSSPLASLTFNQLLRRSSDDRTTVYVVTRPPEETWHKRAVERLAASGRVNIALLPQLHVKLYVAQTSRGSFAMLGSANFTNRSLTNREIGVLVKSFGDGKALVRELRYEAAEVYRHPDRKLISRAGL